jgi:ribose transport system ATP-binding protein
MNAPHPADSSTVKVSDTSAPGLSLHSLTKRFSGITVVKDVAFTIAPGSVIGLVGENGAGKSTTSAMIAGMLQPDDGHMTINGVVYEPKSPGDALKSGVALIHQEIRMVPDLSVAENIFLGRLPMKRGMLDRDEINDKSREILTLLGSAIDPRRPIRGLSIAAQQEIEIARALTRNPDFIIFDEPSASLGESETERVFDQIHVMKDRGVGIIYISHRLDEITRLSDSIVCMRDGAVVGTWSAGDVGRDDIVRAMVGRDFTYGHSEPPEKTNDVVLEVRGLGRYPAFEDVNFTLHKGEIIGVSGLVGAGRTEMVRTIAGADVATSGEVIVDGVRLDRRHPESTITAGIAMVPEDRKSLGLNLNRTGQENMTLPWEKVLAKRGIVTKKVLEREAKNQVEFLDIRGRTDIPVRFLSGGNQQKVLLGKWLIKRPKVLILDEPTRGVDVGAKMTIYETIRNLAEQGVGIIVVSSELEEALGLSHRILVMSGGRQQGILDRQEATPEKVMELAVLGHDQTVVNGSTPTDSPTADRSGALEKEKS